MREQLDFVTKTVHRLRKSIELKQLELHYQLQFELCPPYRPSGLEALLRWRDHENNYIAPEIFIPLAEEHGLMPEINKWVLSRACEDNKVLISEGLLDVAVAVNICGRFFAQDDFVALVSTTLSRVALPVSRLEVEVTETIAIHDVSRAVDTIIALHDIGVEVAIDDFGAGYFSLKLLKSLPVDRLKIDKLFISDFPNNAFDKAVVQAVLNIAKSVGVQVVAEGVETLEQANALREQGCQFGQGYWYSKPLSIDDLKEALKNNHIFGQRCL
nr:EAL domain-containing protein [Pseudomonas sp. PH1b]